MTLFMQGLMRVELLVKQGLMARLCFAFSLLGVNDKARLCPGHAEVNGEVGLLGVTGSSCPLV